MDVNSNIAAWMIGGGLKSTDTARDRHFEHLRALKESPPAPSGLVARLAAALASIRPAATTDMSACCTA